MTRSAFRLVLILWLCAAGAAFIALFENDAADDYVGWIPAMVIVQIPVFLALRPRVRAAESGDATEVAAPTTTGEALVGARRWALVLPSALVAGFGVFWIVGSLGWLIWKPTWLELRPLLLGMFAGFVGVIVAGVVFARIVRDAPHPRGARLVLLAVAGLGLAGVGIVALRLGSAPGPREAMEWFVVAVPAVWVVPLWLVLAAGPRPEPPIPRVIVSR